MANKRVLSTRAALLLIAFASSGASAQLESDHKINEILNDLPLVTATAQAQSNCNGLPVDAPLILHAPYGSSINALEIKKATRVLRLTTSGEPCSLRQ